MTALSSLCTGHYHVPSPLPDQSEWIAVLITQSLHQIGLQGLLHL